MSKLSKLPYLVVALFVLTLLAGCSGEPWMLSQSSSGVTLRWWSDEIADAQAAAMAGAYCTRMGKAVELGDIERDGSAAIGRYRCI